MSAVKPEIQINFKYDNEEIPLFEIKTDNETLLMIKSKDMYSIYAHKSVWETLSQV